MLNPILLYGGILLLFVVGMFLYLALRGKRAAQVRSLGPFPLGERKTLLTSDLFASADAANQYLKSGTGTFSCFVYLDNLARTGSAIDCGTRPNQPSCATGLYEPCKCSSPIDCGNCAHTGYKTLFSLYGVYNFEILNVPDASRPNSVSAQLTLRTDTRGAAGPETYVESLSLPPLPLQKWVMITIGKDGRRVDVYYNDKIVSSSKLLHMLSVQSSNGVICQAGDTGLSGVIAVLRMQEHTYTTLEVSSEYTALTDTRGRPLNITTDTGAYTATSGPLVTSEFLHTLCLDGSCLSMPNFPTPGPEGPIYDLTSPYA